MKNAIPIEEAVTTHGQWKQVDNSTLDFTVDGETVRLKITAPPGLTVTSEEINEYGNPFTRVALRVLIHAGDKVEMSFTPLAH